MKALETPEEKRARRLKKKQEKERRRREKMGWDKKDLVSLQSPYCVCIYILRVLVLFIFLSLDLSLASMLYTIVSCASYIIIM